MSSRCVFNLGKIDTNPGSANNPFTPPAEFKGDSTEYVALMRHRYRDLDHGQRMEYLKRQFLRSKGTLGISGPFENEARNILKRLCDV